MQAVEVGSVMHSLRGVTSPEVVATTLGNVADPLYVVVQLVAVGSVMQLFTGSKSVLIVVTSVDSVEQVAPSHLEARTCGNAVDAP